MLRNAISEQTGASIHCESERPDNPRCYLFQRLGSLIGVEPRRRTADGLYLAFKSMVWAS